MPKNFQMHAINNMIVVFGLPILYIVFAIALYIRTSLIKESPQAKSTKKQYGVS